MKREIDNLIYSDPSWKDNGDVAWIIIGIIVIFFAEISR
jgi:hypothetical protein